MLPSQLGCPTLHLGRVWHLHAACIACRGALAAMDAEPVMDKYSNPS